MLIGGTAAEALGIGHRHVVHAPAVVRTSYPPPITVRHRTLPRFVNRMLWTLSSGLLNRALLPTFNERRRSLGLEPVHGLDELPARDLVVAMDEALGPLPPDTDPRVRATGYWTLDTNEPVDPVVEAFLDDGEAPLYIGFGSMTNRTPRRTLRLIRRAAEVRVLVAAGWAGYSGENTRRFLVVDRVAHRQVLPLLRSVMGVDIQIGFRARCFPNPPARG
jgi:UDP:flavonoid glycosyltransferase YjiC (YdhE family)